MKKFINFLSLVQSSKRCNIREYVQKNNIYISGEEDKLLPDVTLYLVKMDDNSVTLMSLEQTEDNRYDNN